MFLFFKTNPEIIFKCRTRKFNNGQGAILCNNCRIILKQNLKKEDYENNTSLLCKRCIRFYKKYNIIYFYKRKLRKKYKSFNRKLLGKWDLSPRYCNCKRCYRHERE